jgi:hypothetical protein
LISVDQIRGLIESTLTGLGEKYASKQAVDLVLATGVVESRYNYIRQLGDGPAKSFWQVEPATAVDTNMHFLKHRTSLMRKCADVTLVDMKHWQANDTSLWSKILEVNIAAGIVHCRLKYWRIPKRLPNTIEGQANYWKEWYNTHQGAGHVEDFIEAAKDFIVGK